MKDFLIILFALRSIFIFASPPGSSPPQEAYTYAYLRKMVVLHAQDSLQGKKYRNAWLFKSRREKNYREEVDAIRDIMYHSDKKFLVQYADSLLDAAQKTRDASLIGKAWLSKGIAFYDRNKNEQALACFLQADRILAVTDETYDKQKVRYAIANTKYYLGFYNEAKSLFLQCLDYYKEENDVAYLSTLYSLSLCEHKLGHFEKSLMYSTMGKTEIRHLQNTELIPYFDLVDGMNFCSQGQYTKAVEKLKVALQGLQPKNDKASIAVCDFYLGKSLIKSGNEEEGLDSLMKTEKYLTSNNTVRPDLRGTYELIIDHYNKLNDPKNSLKYMVKLISFDSILNHDFRYLSKRLTKEYDTKRLRAEKEMAESKLARRNYFDVLGSLGFLAIVTGLIIRYMRNKKKYEAKYKLLMATVEDKQSKKTPDPSKGLDINAEILEVALQNLDRFEKEYRYMAKDMDLNKLAAYLKTNPKYAARIILHYRGKKTLDYIRDLKIAHIVELLKTEPRYRNYTLKALGEEAGIKSAQMFTKAFVNYTGMKPAYFIERLQEEENADTSISDFA